MAMASEANMNGWIERNLRFTIPERFDTILQQADAPGILLLEDGIFIRKYSPSTGYQYTTINN